MCMKLEKKNIEEWVGQGYKTRKQHTHSLKVDSVSNAAFDPNIKRKENNKKKLIEIISLI